MESHMIPSSPQELDSSYCQLPPGVQAQERLATELQILEGGIQERPSLSCLIGCGLETVLELGATEETRSSRADTAFEDGGEEYEDDSEKELCASHHSLLMLTPVDSVCSSLSSEDHLTNPSLLLPPPSTSPPLSHFNFNNNTNNSNSCELHPLATPSGPATSNSYSCEIHPLATPSAFPPTVVIDPTSFIAAPQSIDPTSFVSPHPPPSSSSSLPPSDGAPPSKRFRSVKHGSIDVTLEGKALWDEFCRRGTEMIVNRTGRRMFPGYSVAVTGLKPKAKYTMKLEVILADNHRFKFLNGRWLAVGTAEPQPLSRTYLHPDSPNSGAFWMRHGISFRKLKITNNKDRPGNNALLHSMHKYYLRLLVEEERRVVAGEERQPARNVLSLDFPETTFVAVTAYQNEEVTQLKITNNPFAKAFRENAADIDWETAQALYGGQFVPSGFSPQLDHFTPPSSLTPGTWPSPLLLPTPGSLPPISPLTTFTPHGSTAPYRTPSGHHYPYTSSSSAASSSISTSHYFQWPQVQRMPSTSQQLDMYDPYAKPLPPSSQPHHPHTITYHPHPSLAHNTPLLQPQPPISVANSNLPDFDSVFTCNPSLGHSSHDVMS